MRWKARHADASRRERCGVGGARTATTEGTGGASPCTGGVRRRRLRPGADGLRTLARDLRAVEPGSALRLCFLYEGRQGGVEKSAVLTLQRTAAVPRALLQHIPCPLGHLDARPTRTVRVIVVNMLNGPLIVRVVLRGVQPNLRSLRWM